MKLSVESSRLVLMCETEWEKFSMSSRDTKHALPSMFWSIRGSSIFLSNWNSSSNLLFHIGAAALQQIDSHNMADSPVHIFGRDANLNPFFFLFS